MIFPITQILREIDFGDSRSAKSAILTHLEALNSYMHKPQGHGKEKFYPPPPKKFQNFFPPPV